MKTYAAVAFNGITFILSFEKIDSVLQQLSLRRADHSSRAVLPSVVSECYRETSIMRRPWPTRGCRAIGGGSTVEVHVRTDTAALRINTAAVMS
jgi:hypothetical protein